MTCIVGCLSGGGSVWMGGDSAGVAGASLQVRADRKVFRRGPYVMGFTSSFRMGQALAHLGHLPEPSGEDPMRFMVVEFVEAVRKLLRDAGCMRIDNNREDGGTFMVGWHGNLFIVNDDFQVAQMVAPFASVGGGFQLALGAMDALPSTMRVNDPRRFLEDALTVVQRWNTDVRAPFHVLSTEGETTA